MKVLFTSQDLRTLRTLLSGLQKIAERLNSMILAVKKEPSGVPCITTVWWVHIIAIMNQSEKSIVIKFWKATSGERLKNLLKLLLFCRIGLPLHYTSQGLSWG